MKNVFKTIVAVTLLFGVSLSGGEGDNSEYYYHDRVRSLISIKLGVTGVVFDTSDWSDSRGQLPEWRFMGNLKVDSLIVNGYSKVALTQESHMESVFFNSWELCEAFDKINARSLIKTFPNRVPEDTIYENAFRGEEHKVGDLSVFYEVRYDSLISYDSVSQILSGVPKLE
jgi:hypothetical protein